MEKTNNSPFLELLKEENLKKIKITDDLIPTFKIVIYKIDDYFKKNNLLEARNWKYFFERFLLSSSEEQMSMRVENETKEGIGGRYDKDNKKLSIVKPDDIYAFCHEFIHFLVMHDSNSFNSKISDSSFFNEGMTEYLSSCIMSGGNHSLYVREFNMAEFYCKITQTKNPFVYFLNDKFAFDDDYYAPINLIRNAERFQNENSLDSYLNIQREIIRNGLDDYEINTFDDFINIITIINQRPGFDGEYIDTIFEKISDNYIENLGLSQEQNVMIKKKLIRFCKVSNKYQLYGDNEVTEYLIDDLHIAFDKDGNHYNDFPLNGKRTNGQCGFDPSKGVISIVHRDKRYQIDANKMNCKNWKLVYEKYFQQLKNELQIIENQPINKSSYRH